MKILWVKADFLHPTTYGGQIRTLETLRILSRRNEVHYVGLDNGQHPEGPRRAEEYSARSYAIPHRAPSKRSAAFAWQLAAGLVSKLPVTVARYRSRPMRQLIERLLATERFDRIVCDFLFPAPNLPDLSRVVLFEHNVETMIWRRHTEHAADPIRRAYLGLQARRMAAYEGSVCRKAGYVIAVSENDASILRREFGAERVAATPTGVDLDYFQPPEGFEKKADLVFLGSMDWMANIDAIRYFTDQILPKIRSRMPSCTVAVVGRNPTPGVLELARKDPGLIVTGTVPDVRPFLWGSTISIVPLRVGGGTRLKIYEAMAAKIPVVSTTVGAEGLPLVPGRDIAIADSPEGFAEACAGLLEDGERRRAMVGSAYAQLRENYSWEAVSRRFEDILREAPPAQGS